MQTDLVEYYARRAAEYERVYDKPERQRDLQELRDLCGWSFRHLDVLELSCGTGYWTEVIAPSAKSVLACDVNEEMLEIARNKDWRHGSVEFRKADSFALPNLVRRFPAAFSAFWWSHVPKKRIPAFLDGVHSQLQPDALVMFIDNRYVEGSSTPISRTDEHDDTYQQRRLEDGSVHEVLKNFPNEAELAAAVGGMGHSIEVTMLEFYWVLTYHTKAM